MGTQTHKLTEVQSHSFVLVFVTMQGRLSPAAQPCVHTGALKCWGQKDGALWAWWDFSASQSFWLLEVLSFRAHSSAQSSKDTSRASQQHLPTPSNTISGPITSARAALSQNCSFPTLLCPLKHILPKEPLPARATAGGDFQFAFSLLFLVSPLRWGLRLWLRLKNQTPTKHEGKMIKHFPLCWMHCQLKYPLISAPFHLTVYGVQSTDRAVMWKRRLFPVPLNTPWQLQILQ